MQAFILIIAVSLAASGAHSLPDERANANSTGAGSVADLAGSSSAPERAMTSVHQVWTSTSSGRLDELSPDVIGRLHGSVPFLAAYALRPRLVGPMSENEPDGAIRRASGQLLDAESSPKTYRAPAQPRLADYDELKVETSSLSKSEHRHKRKTSLKKQAERAEKANYLRQGYKPADTNRRSIERAAVRGQKARVSGRSQWGRRPTKDSRSRLLLELEGRGEEGGVKGASAPTGKQPFYQGAVNKPDATASQPGSRGHEEAESQEGEGSAEDEEPEKGEPAEAEGQNSLEPKRVGEADIEKDGDSVLVKPKSDGVDDDPEPPSDGVEEDSGDDNDDDGDDEHDDEHDDDRREGAEERAEADRGEKRGAAGEAGAPSAAGGVGAAGSTSGKGFGSRNKNGPGAGDSTKGINENGPPEERETSGDSGEQPETGKPVEEEEKELSPRVGAGKRRRVEDSGDSGADVDYRDNNSEEPESDQRVKLPPGAGTKAGATEGANHNDDNHCVDRNNDDHHYDDHHHHHHHHHHNSIKWLEDAVPGQPGYDYPILSHTNGTGFNCRDYKYSGYYADVKARCQVFHICQADGRQDSFL